MTDPDFDVQVGITLLWMRPSASTSDAIKRSQAQARFDHLAHQIGEMVRARLVAMSKEQGENVEQWLLTPPPEWLELPIVDTEGK